MIRTRDMLIEWLREHTSNDRVIHNAAYTGRIENYGVFCSAPGSTSAGWVLAITTPQARYRVVVIENELHEWVRWYRVRPAQIDWSAWVGDQFHAEIYRGDQPEVYAGCRKAVVATQQLSRSGAEEADPNISPETHRSPGDAAPDRPVDQEG